MSSVLVPFLPRGVVTLLAEEPQTSGPRQQRLEGAFLRLELTNLARWVETHCLSGNLGPAAISQLLDRSLSPLLHTLLDGGGDILTLHEQSLVAFWPVGNDERTLKDAILQALHAGQTLLQQAQGNERLSGTSLSLRVAVTSGVAELWHLQGSEHQRRLLLVGPPLLELAQCITRMQPHELQLTASGRALVGERVQGQTTQEGGLKVTAIRPLLPPRRYTTLPPMLLTPDQLLLYLSPWVKRELPRGPFPQNGQRQRMTVLALTLPLHPTPLAQADTEQLLSALETLLAPTRGLLHRFWHDGAMLHAVVLFPPSGARDERMGSDPSTVDALRLAQQLCHAPLNSAGTLHVAVVVGTLFCGAFGSRRRAEYMALGEALTSAQRLLRNGLGGVVCDFNAFQAGRETFTFSPLPVRSGPDVALEGPLFLMGEPLAQPDATTFTLPRGFQPLWQALEQHRDTRQGGLWLVKSEEGLGLELVFRQLRRHAQGLGVCALWGMAEPSKRSTPLAAMSWPLRQLLGLEQALSREEARQRAYEQLQASPQVREQASRLNAILPLDLEGLDPIRWTGQTRQLELFDMLELLLRKVPHAQPTLLTLEEVQYLDSATWTLLHRLSAELPTLMVVLGLSSVALEQTPASEQVLRQPWLKQLVMERLTPEECLQQLAQHSQLMVQFPDMAEKLFHQTQGHPYLLQFWLKQALGGQPPTLPLLLHQVLQRQLSSASPLQALLLQTASVIGCVFSYRLLVAIFPLRQALEHLPQLLEGLRELGIERLDAPEPELLYHFRLPILQHLAYHQLSFSQRMALHESIARWYSAQLVEDRSSLFGTEAHHWERALNAERASGSLRRAGEHAIAHGAAVEAVELFEQTLAQERLLARPMERLDRARTLRQLGQALLLIGRLDEGTARLEDALKELEEPEVSRLLPRPVHLLVQFIALVLALRRMPDSEARSPRRRWNPFYTPPVKALPPSTLPTLAQDERLKLLAELLRLSFLACRSLNNIRLLLKLLHQTRQLGRPAPLALGYGVVAALMIHIRRPQKFQQWQRLALDLLRQEECSVDAAHAYRILAINQLLLTEWQQALPLLQHSELMCRQLRDTQGLLDSLGLHTWLHLLRGDIPSYREVGQQLFEEARRMGQLRGQYIGLHALLHAALMRGEETEALMRWQELRRLPTMTLSPSDQLTHTGLHAHILLMQGQLQEARIQIEHLAALIDGFSTRILNVQAFLGCIHLLNTLLEIMERTHIRKLQSRVARRIFLKLRMIVLLSGERIPAFKPISTLLEGRMLRLYGPSWSARRILTRGLSLSRRADMKLAEQLCLIELELLIGQGQSPAEKKGRPLLSEHKGETP